VATKRAKTKKKDPLAGRNAKLLARLRKICLALPDATEAVSWGQPTFKVGGKIFASFSPGHGGLHIAFKARNRDVLKVPRVVETPWSKQGWVMRMIGEDETELDWDALEPLIEESHALVAAKKDRTRGAR
jgi:predicted DNA-binding protein (MmcQ/YjbR family)